MLDILCYIEIPHPLGGGGFDVLNPPGALGWGISDFETPGAPGVGDLRFGAPMQTLVEIVNQNNSSRNLKVVLISSVFCRLSFFDDRK